MRFPSRIVSIRWSLLRNLFILIAILSGSLLLTTFLGTRTVVRELAATLIDRTVRIAESELERFLVPAGRALLVLGDWVGDGAVGMDDVESFVTLFHPVLQQFPQVGSVNTGDDAGNGLHLLRLRTESGTPEWRTREVRPNEWGGRARFIRRDAEGRPLEEWFEETDYDPREQPWFLPHDTGAPGVVRWTDPYEFYSTDEPGLSASTATTQSNGPGDRRVVIAFDVRLEAVSALTTEISPSANGLAFVLTERGETVGLPRDSRFATPESRRQSILTLVESLGIESLRDGTAEWRRRVGLEGDERIPSSGAASDSTFDFTSGGRTFWAAVRRYPLDVDTALLIGVGIPQDDFFVDEERQRFVLLGATIAAVGLAIGMALLLARGYSRPLRDLVRQSERLRELDTSSRPPPTSRLREVVQLANAQEGARSALESFARYIPIEVVRGLLRRGTAARIGGEVRPISIVFSDIRNFTTIAESMEPDALTAHVAEYFETLVDILSDNGGTIDKFIGDAIVTFWGAPNPDPEHPLRAVRSALLCRDRVAERNLVWKGRGLPPLHTRFGIATGKALVGNVGAPRRLSYTAIGDTANVASRLQDVNRHYGTDILASDAARDATRDQIVYRRVDRAILRGKHAVVTLFEPLGLAGAVPAEKLDLARSYEEAFELYAAREFESAVAALDRLTARFPMDGPAERLRKLCVECLERGAPEDWDGVTRFG